MQTKDPTFTHAKDFDEVLKATNALRREQEEESRLGGNMREQKMVLVRRFALFLITMSFRPCALLIWLSVCLQRARPARHPAAVQGPLELFRLR